ncbi:MAG: radical SAM protein [Candidatus Omnitrophica bacterium]|nr:radical SAM protein [Candidatus Omnitrophota bacterium]MCF7893654.1 radical SAM protein [Candidatus Omnitrophota bacterium]
MNLPYLLFADKEGKIHSHPYLRMAGALLDKFCLPGQEELIAAPSGTTFFYLPDSYPLGYDPLTKKVEQIEKVKGKRVYPVSAFLPPSYLRLYNPAAKFAKKRQKLPLWAYTACGFYGGKFKVAAKKIDKRIRQSPGFYNNKLIEKNANIFLKKYSQNRLYRHLFNCALNYNCLAAKNLFMQRWEAPLPVARFCNARCIGCLSKQDKNCIASHQRINFKPSILEVSEIMSNHLKQAKEAIVSFGQGCEGEPLLEADLIAESIKQVRQKTKRGTININTNGSYPDKIEQLCQAGVDSFRISLNSPEEKFYNLYFRPKNYRFLDVCKSIKVANKYNKFVSLNLFIFPGFSDSRQQIDKLIKFLKKNKIDMIQWRNLNIDPLYYANKIAKYNLNPTGILNLISNISNNFFKIKMGYFNLPKEKF